MCYGEMDLQESMDECHYHLAQDGSRWGCPLAHGCFVASFKRKMEEEADEIYGP